MTTSLAQLAPPMMPPPGMPGTAPPQQGDPTVQNPSQGTPEEKQKQAGLSNRAKANLLLIEQRYLQQWSSQYRVIVRDVLQIIEYLKGNQFYLFDGSSFTFSDPFTAGSTQGSEQKQDDLDVYKKVTNIIQWFERVFVSSLSAQIPATRFWPGNAESDLDNRTAINASRANALIERQNKAKELLQQCLSYLCVSGCYFRYTRYVRDDRLAGDNEEEYGTEEMQEQEVAPARYLCRQCGAETPANPMQMQAQCDECDAPLSSADFHPAMKLPMPVITGNQSAPEGRVKQSLYNALHVQVAPTVDEAEDGVMATPMLRLSLEIDLGVLRSMYPQCWTLFTSAGDMTTGGVDDEVGRQYRLRSLAPASSNYMLRANAVTTTGMPTYSRAWLQPEAFNILDDQNDAAELQKLFPKGVCVASVNNQFLDARPVKLTDEWTWCGTRRGMGMYSPPVLKPAMDPQDTLNDMSNTMDEFYDRCASPGGFADSRYLGKGLNGRFLPPGSWMPVKVTPELGQDLTKAFFQPKIELDQSIHKRFQDVIQLCQLLLGVTPQMWGGTQENIDTASGQQQALNVATGIMHQYWERVRGEHAESAKLAVRCLANNATADLYDVIQGDDPATFKNQPIDIEGLKGEINAYPEADQGYPISFQQQRDLFVQMIQNAPKNPIIMEWFDSLKNRRTAARYVLPMDTEVPGEIQRRKIIRDITQLIKGQPIQQPGQPDPMTGMPGPPVTLPSVLPDPDFDDPVIAKQAVQEYVEQNYAELAAQPPVLENLRAYVRLSAQYAKTKQIQEQMPPGGMPPQAGPAGAPAGPPPSPPTAPPTAATP